MITAEMSDRAAGFVLGCTFGGRGARRARWREAERCGPREVSMARRGSHPARSARTLDHSLTSALRLGSSTPLLRTLPQSLAAAP